MSGPRVAHVVRDFGGLTEPFIAHRILVGAPSAVLWTERSRAAAEIPERRIPVRVIRAGTPGDRAFHHLAALGPPFAGGYAAEERSAAPDVIHAHYLTTGYLVGSRTRAPLVVSTYGFDISVMGRRPGWAAAFRAIGRRASAFLTEGPHMARVLASMDIDAARIHVVPIAAGLESIPYRSPQPGSGPLRLVVCGRFVEKKGHDVAIRAFAAALPRLPAGSTLDIVGSGPQEAEIRELVARLGMATSVRLLGALPRAAYLETLAAADLLLAPSRTARNGDSEGGAPTTILDAQATGVPVIGSRHGDIPFLVEDGRKGYLVPEDDADGLAEGIVRAIDDSTSWATIARAARDQVVTRHSDEVVAALIGDIHEQVASR